MSNTERRKLLQSLNKRRRRLISQNANINDIKDYLGFSVSEKLGNKSTKELKRLQDRINNLPRVKVENRGGDFGNVIYPTSYSKKFEIWNGKGGTRQKATSFKNALDSNLSNENESLKELRQRKKAYESQFVEYYASQVENLGDKELANKIRKMKKSDLSTMIKKGKGTISPDKVFYGVQFESINDYLNYEDSILNDIRSAFNDFSNSRR